MYMRPCPELVMFREESTHARIGKFYRRERPVEQLLAFGKFSICEHNQRYPCIQALACRWSGCITPWKIFIIKINKHQVVGFEIGYPSVRVGFHNRPRINSYDVTGTVDLYFFLVDRCTECITMYVHINCKN